MQRAQESPFYNIAQKHKIIAPLNNAIFAETTLFLAYW